MTIRFVPPAAVAALFGVVAALTHAPGQQPSIFKDGFAGRSTALQRGDSNIQFTERDHKISGEHNHSAPTAEYVKIEANPPAGAAEPEFAHYYYATPPAPVTDRLSASVWVKAFRPGVQVKARVVFPRERDPKNPDAPLTALVPGDTYDTPRQWKMLGFGDVEAAMRKLLPVLHARLGRAVDPTGAYLDRIVLNVYAGPGVTEVWVDDLEVGPVRTDVAPPKPVVDPPGAAAAPVGRPKGQTGGVPVEFAGGQILVGGDPFFMLAVRHTGTPLKTLRDAQFNTVWFPTEVHPQTLEEAIRHGFWVVPTLPLPAGEWSDRRPVRPDPADLERDAELVTRYLRQFLSGDAVLMWDLGGGRAAEDVGRVARAAEIVRRYDPRRPRAINLWDGHSAYATYVNAIGAHRWPLFSSLELTSYKDWLAQRKALTPPGRLFWTWVQTHLPDWMVTTLCGRPDVAEFADPVGPHPEQIRILTYLSLAAGARGLGFWSDKFLSNACHGRDRLLELALLNAEIDMLKPVLLAAGDSARWVATSHPHVQAAVMRSSTEILVLPVWLGPGTQYTPAQGALPELILRVPLVPEGTVPWLVTPAGVTELKGWRRVAGGTEINIPEFDTTAAVVFTSDLGINGKVVRWQDHTRFRLGEQAARWAQQQALEQYNKASVVHEKIVAAGGPAVPEAAELLARAKRSVELAKAYADQKQWDVAYREAKRAQRPVRVLMRAHWDNAARTLDTPSASPYAVSFYSLPQHWAFAREIAAGRPAGNRFPHGGFELSQRVPDEGAAVSSLPGWTVRKLILDTTVAGNAWIGNTDRPGVLDEPLPKPPLPATRYAPVRVPQPPDEVRRPDHGRHCLVIGIGPKEERGPDGAPVPPPQALERAVIAVDSPPADLPPGCPVRISFWAKIPGVGASADGLVVFDSAGGEPLGVRVLGTLGWRQYHLYRRVPPDGKVSLTFALTGFGTAYIDDVRMEPILPGGVVEQTGLRP